MEVDKLAAFVIMIVAVGMIIGVGVLTLTKFGDVTYYTREGFNNSISPTGNNTHTALDFGNISVSKVVNESSQATFSSDCYTLYTTNGTFWLHVLGNVTTCIWEGNAIDVVYDYKEYATATRDATNYAQAEIAKIASDWIGLIITIVALSIILFFVIRSFSGMGR